MEELKIIDIINHKNKYATQRFMVLNRNPVYVYERKGKWLIAEDSGIFNFLFYEKPSGRFYAFAGRKFEIPMKDGSIESAFGQWWDGIPGDYEGLLYRIGCGTPENLSKCNVFCSSNIDPVIVDDWLSKNKPTNNYNKYDKRHADFGVQEIVSKWD